MVKIVDPRAHLRMPRSVVNGLAWALAGVAFWCALVLGCDMWTFPAAIAKNPFPAEAAVTSVFINGFGGDPAVDYRYTVDGRSYTGWGEAQLGHESVLSLNRGDAVAIEYAASDPSKSCPCDAAAQTRPQASTAALDIVLALPVLAVRTFRRRRTK